jgi:hypothetical protein
MNFLLVSETPVAGTVCRFATALAELPGVDSAFPFVLRNYKNSPFDLPYGQMISYDHWANILGEHANKADHIIFHNCAEQSYIDLVKRSANQNTSMSFHMHSPPFEGPLFCYDIITENNFDNVFSVAQGHARFFEESIPIPNIIPDIKIFDMKRRRSAVIIGHLRTTSARWSKKIPENFVRDLDALLTNCSVGVYTIPKLFGCETVPYRTFSQALQNFDYVVDDINSGLFHQISMEGLKSGCIVFSAADEFSVESFCTAANCPPPPFELVSDIHDIHEKIRYYERNPLKLRAAQERNLIFAIEYLGQERISRLSSTKILESISR